MLSRPQPKENCKEIRFLRFHVTDYGHEEITGRFIPNLFIDINELWGKRTFLKAYGSEMREYPHSRSIDAVKNLATTGNHRFSYGESFQVIRKIIYQLWKLLLLVQRLVHLNEATKGLWT